MTAQTPALAASQVKGYQLAKLTTTAVYGDIWIGSYAVGSRHAYCIEAGAFQGGAPTDRTRISSVNGVGAAKMRQLNYLIDTYGQSDGAVTNAAVALAVWKLAPSGKASTYLGWVQNSPTSTGRDVISRMNTLLKDAKDKYDAGNLAPKPAPKISQSITLALNADRRSGRLNVPRGYYTVTLTGAKFAAPVNARTMELSPSWSGSLNWVADNGVREFSATAKWRSTGQAGWEPYLYRYSTGVGKQFIAIAHGKTDADTDNGQSTDQLRVDLPVPFRTSSRAQASAVEGGTMTDTIIVEGAPASLPMPGSVDAIAYLQPVAGATKYDANWNPIETAPGSGVYEQWTQAELDAMTSEQRCEAQPVARSGRASEANGRVPVPLNGPIDPTRRDLTVDPVTVRSPGVIYWVHRYFQGNTEIVTHTVNGVTIRIRGVCGIASERTAIAMPAVTTTAQPSASIGETITDTAHVTGTFAPGREYGLGFEAYSRVVDADGNPVCAVGNSIFNSPAAPLAGTGDVTSPGFVVRREHGTTIWWVETLYQRDSGGDYIPLARGECGLDNETTRIVIPRVITQAQENGVAGDLITDVATVSGAFSANAHARWELIFDVYRAAYTERPDPANPGETIRVPECSAEGRYARTDAVPVTGPGSVTSPGVRVQAGYAGDLWWVERLYLIEDGVRHLVSSGECGLDTETTAVTVPLVVTKAVPVAMVGDELFDTATITGALSTRAGVRHELIFRAYRETRDADGRPVCNTGNLAFTTAPTAVTGPGEYTSEKVPAEARWAGKLWWIETLQLVDGSETVTVAVGRCGLPGETSIVHVPKIVTQATQSAIVGQRIGDTARIKGQLSQRPGAVHRVEFEAFHQAAGTKPRCDVKDRVFISKPVMVTDQQLRRNGGLVKSETFQTTTDDVGEIFWIERLTVTVAGKTYLVHQGICGAVGEITRVTPPLPPTGAAGMLPALIGGSVLLLLGGFVVFVELRRRRRLAETAQAVTGELLS